MSATLKRYESGGEIHLDGQFLAEITKFSLSLDGGLSEVNTTAQGLAGTAAGPIKVELTIVSAIPKAGMERDYGLALKARSVMVFRRKRGGVTESFTVQVSKVDESFDVANAADATIMLIGKPLGAST